MKTLIVYRKYFVFILTIALIAFGTRGSYGQTITASTLQPLTEANLHGSVVTLTLSGGAYEGGIRRSAVTVSGIDGVTFDSWDVEHVSDTEVRVALTFSGNFDTNATLTFTVGADAIVGYNGPALTARTPVTAVEESLVASTAFPLTEATLDRSVVTLTLSGRIYEQYAFEIEEVLKVSGIEGVTVEGYFAIERVSDTEVRVALTSSGDFDTDATLTFTIGTRAIANYNGTALTAQVLVSATEESNATVSVLPSRILSPAVGEQLTFSLNIANGEDIAGYQAIVSFDPSTLRHLESTKGAYLPADTFFDVQTVEYASAYEDFSGNPIFERDYVTITATTLAEVGEGDGTLATLTFRVVDFKASKVTLSSVYLVDSGGKRWEPTTENGEVTEPPEPAEKILGDINSDGVVNIQDLAIVSARFGLRGQNSADINADGLVDIVDLVLVASAIEDDAAAPSMYPQALEMLTSADVRQWLYQAQQLTLTDATSQRGILFLEQLLATLIPKETALLANYPNPFNPETWIPYQLSKPTNVTLHIYAVNGTLVRTLALGHQAAGMYQNRSRAAYWDGKNEVGEPVASGLYFYTLTAGNFSATRKMLIQK